MAEHEPSIGATSEVHSAGILRGPEPRPLTAKTGGPLGSANDFSNLEPKRSLVSGRHLQLFSNGRCFRRSVRGHAVIVGSRRPEAICVTAGPASVLNRHRC
jgi:hypothetical protein